jgi:hypothetical protein
MDVFDKALTLLCEPYVMQMRQRATEQWGREPDYVRVEYDGLDYTGYAMIYPYPRLRVRIVVGYDNRRESAGIDTAP